MIFQDRKTAGQKLAEALAKYKNSDAVVYALPRGGVAVGVKVAQALHIPLALVIVRKIGHPDTPEYAIAAVTEDGTLVANQAEVAAVDQEWFRKEVETQKKEAQRRRAVYGAQRAPVQVGGKIAIIVDDGIATGLTLKAALAEIKKQKPKKLVVAIPVGPRAIIEEVRRLADEVVVLHAPKFFLGAIGAYYQLFPQMRDEDVVDLLKQFPT